MLLGNSGEVIIEKDSFGIVTVVQSWLYPP